MKETPEQVLSDIAINYVYGNAAQCIIEELGLVNKDHKLTRYGKLYLWTAFSKNKGL